MNLTPPRPLDTAELRALAELEASLDRSWPLADVLLRQKRLLHELVIARAVIREVKKVRRCLPKKANAALDWLPHVRQTAVEFRHD